MVTVTVTEVVSRQKISVDISEDSTVRQLKSLIEGKGLGPVNRQRLAHAGKLLADEMKLDECGLVSIPFVVLSLRPAPADSTVGAMSQGPRPLEDVSHSPYIPTTTDQSETDDTEEDANIPTCRICHGKWWLLALLYAHSKTGTTGTEQNDETGRLFSPCLCRQDAKTYSSISFLFLKCLTRRGSMRFVHVSCLNRWRSLSTNPR